MKALAACVLALCATGAAADALTDEGRRLFNGGVAPAPACALCHALKDAGASGAVGPNLDELKPDAARVEQVLRNGMGPMPAFRNLSDEQVSLLARYVARASGAAP